MYTIVGLGNPGAEYENTRHNAGRIAAEEFVRVCGFPDFVESGKFSGRISEGTYKGTDVRVLLPDTFMNNSGGAVSKALAEGGDVAKLIVLHDELDLPIGSFKISEGKGNAGHNGVRSIIDTLHTNEFKRIRIGISPVSIFGNMKRPTGARIGDFVLKEFSRGERNKLSGVVHEVVETLKALLVQEG